MSAPNTENSRKGFDTGLANAFAEGNQWFSQLPAVKQSEVVKFAALHIANNSLLFQQPQHDGNSKDYLRLTLAIARSDVVDAEKIFVEAALQAEDPDREEELRNFFQNCSSTDPDLDDVTVGTLFNIARRFGADFAPWENILDACNHEVLFVPGNEAKCRRQLDRAVAADARTFSLGDPSGPLVILRVPEANALPPDTRWDGDLPGTTLATPADVMQRAERIKWFREGRSGPYRSRPPRDFISDYLTQLHGQYGARPLRGIVRVPRIDDQGSIHFVSGYDAETGLFHDRVPTFVIPSNPSADQVHEAVEILLHPFSQYQFEDPIAGRPLLLAGVFTALERPFLTRSPMFVFRSPMPGTGKGLLVRGLVRLAFDTAPVAITWGGSSEEFEKRLAALLLQTPSVLSIDNANGMEIKGDLLESIITEGCADIRPLGHSKIVKVATALS